MIEAVKNEVILVTRTGLDTVAAKAARFCTSSKSMKEILTFPHPDGEVLERVMDLGHLSVTEHWSATFGISGISRVTEVQLMRHRIAVSPSVKSGRYTKIKEVFHLVVPPSIQNHPDVRVQAAYRSRMEQAHASYLELLEQGVAAEDARYLLPQATATQLLVTMNARALLHFFELRCCGHAQWEIRDVAYKMLAICKQLQPTIFKKAGPPCECTGFCTEQKSCGRKPLKQGE